MKRLLEIKNVSAGYVVDKKTNVVVADACLSLCGGQLVSMLGANGAGKTKQLIDLIHSAVESENGSVVCIEPGADMTFDIKSINEPQGVGQDGERRVDRPHSSWRIDC